MTDPQRSEREQATDPKAEPDQEPEVDAELLGDLDPPDDDVIRGGSCDPTVKPTR